MREWLIAATEVSTVIIDAMALLTAVAGTVVAFSAALRLLFSHADGHTRRDVWLTYSRWLVAALTFQLASDIIESSVTTSWETVGRLAAIAVIRTFLNYFLERDLKELRERQRELVEAPAR